MITISWDELREHAKRLGIPPRTLAQVRQTIAECKKKKSDASMARLMLHHGVLEPDAREWLAREYPQ